MSTTITPSTPSSAGGPTGPAEEQRAPSRMGPALTFAKKFFSMPTALAGTIILLLGVMTVIGTFISDLLLMWVDPRIRLGRE